MKALRLLIVEDVDEMRLFLEQVMKAPIHDAASAQVSFQVTGTARNVWEARMELGRRKPDALLLDEVLPGESSLDLLAEALEMGVRVILLTGMENATHPIPAGVLGRLQKPAWDGRAQDQERFRQDVLRFLLSSS